MLLLDQNGSWWDNHHDCTCANMLPYAQGSPVTVASVVGHIKSLRW